MTATDPPGGGSRGGVGQVYALFAVSLALVLLVGSSLQAMLPRGGLALTELLLILVPALWFVRRAGMPFAGALRLRPLPVVRSLLCFLLGVAGWGVAVQLHELVSLVLGPAPPATALLATTSGEWLLLLLVGAVLPGICEETLFRGAIQGVLERRGAGRAVIVTAVLFGLYHLNPWSLIPAVFLGLVFGALMVRCGSIVAPVLAHIGNNTAAISVGYLLRDRPAAIGPLSAGLIVGFALLLLVLLRATRGQRPSVSPLAHAPAGMAGSATVWLKAAGVVALLAVAALTALVVALVDVRTVPNADLEPELRRGDRVVVLLDSSGRRPLRAGDVVLYELQGRELLARVVREEEAGVWLEAGAGEVEVPRERVRGRVVYPEPRRAAGE